MDIESLYTTVLGLPPYDFQRRFALGPSPPRALVVQTGAGKTATVSLGWIYRRRFAALDVRRSTPRRLVLCMPMRTLVQQAAGRIREWLEKLGLLDASTGVDRGDGISVHVLMGGREDEAWHIHPDRDAIIIGTQDVLLSGALNRGYGVSRFAWPWRFALLSNDCFWVFDEVQLMGPGLSTGLQLEAFRSALGAYGPHSSVFMSATLDASWLSTVDSAPPDPDDVLSLSAADLESEPLLRRRKASKAVERARTLIAKDCEKPLAKEILARHQPKTRTLVIVNRVDRATLLYKAIRQAGKVDVVLVHSRFRPAERDEAIRRATADDFDGIVVSTQVVEAGVDMTSQTLFTELSPWASFVQRAGRCNRDGKASHAAVVWVDHDNLDDKSAKPYETADLLETRARLQDLENASPERLEQSAGTFRPPVFEQVLRRRDILDLFDTTADLSGADIDVSRFIRDGDERDVRVFWREKQDAQRSRPSREELCAVPVYEFQRFLEREDRPRAYRWDAVEGAYKEARSRELFPGLTILVECASGGYQADLGWSTGSRVAVPEILVDTSGDASMEPAAELESLGEDPLTELPRQWINLRTHSLDAKREAEALLARMPDIDESTKQAVARAANAHDAGKAHPVFVNSMAKLGGAAGEVWAKSGVGMAGQKQGSLRHDRPYFRHELASALAWLQTNGDHPAVDLIAYLVAAHHGKVRAGLRAIPGEKVPDSAGEARLYARGIWDGDRLPEVDLGDFRMPATTLSLELMRLGSNSGQRSWTDRVVALRDAPELGPFRLAFLEALVRAADVRASIREEWSKEVAP